MEAARSAFGRAKKGTLAKTRPDDLLGMVYKGLLEKTGIDPAIIGGDADSRRIAYNLKSMPFCRAASPHAAAIPYGILIKL